ncbi:MAG TPA: tripartite tricarboxylate transporter substrate binding protein [Beijerinckiaceae bacterium]|nr:tripartite tricarboxylate transporter substrate binding protein [Beijerinckiaceae bacterium]
MLTRRMLIAAAAAAATGAAPLRAQARYPDKPIRLIVPFGPGGLADITSRVVGDRLSQVLGQRIVIVNQPGAGGVAAAQTALTGPADGYTLVLFTNGTAISVPLVKELGYDPLTQFAPVSSLGFFDFLILTSGDHPHKTLGDLLAAAKARPGALNIGTINVGSSQNLSANLFRSMANVSMEIVPFRTTPDAITALLRKDVDLVIDGYVAAKALMQEGKLRALATSGPRRFAGLPDVPTVAESGVPGFDVTSWNAVFAPAGTPAEVVRVLNEAIVSSLGDAGVRQRLLDLGIEPGGGTPAAIGERLKTDIARWGEVIRRAGIQQQ